MESTQSSLREYAKQLNDTRWLTVLGYAYALFITIGLLRYMAPEPWRAPVKALGLALPLMLLAAKDLASLPDVAARLRALRRQGAGWPRWVAACLPPGLIGLARLERAIWRGFFGWLRRQPGPARPSGLALTFDRQGAYPTAIAFGLFSIIVELPLGAAILPLFIDDSATLRNIHLVFALGSVYSLVWLLGDRWLVRGGHHVLTATHLDLQVGARASARIALAAIEDAQLLRQSAAHWRKTHPYRLMDAVNVTPFDKPNLVLRLDPDAGCTIAHHGLERSGVRYLFLYLDRPERLIDALAPATPRSAA